tara:strand:- start:1314 stop:1514 length:201 start_codon:yes stop_codon:yes gene_type:complete
MAKGRTISRDILNDESGRTISDADRARAKDILNDESGRTISDADRMLLRYLRDNDGPGKPKKTKLR